MTDQKLITPINDWHKVAFTAQITESIHNVGPYPETSKELRVKGAAIHATTTRNGTKFVEEELRKAANTLVNKPILKDHNNSVDSIVGRVTIAYYDNEAQAIMYEGVVKDSKAVELIEQGLITSVSIGAVVGDFEDLYNEDGEVIETIVKDIDFVEVSLVAVPADPKASVTKAFYEAYNNKLLCSSNTCEENKMEEQEMDKKTISEESDSVSEQISSLSSIVSEALGRFEETTKNLSERLDAIEAKIVEEVTVIQPALAKTDSEVNEEVVEEAIDETVSVVENTSTDEFKEESKLLHLTPSRNGWSMSGDYSSFGAVRLAR